MGAIHQLRWDRPRTRSAPEISPRRGGPSIIFWRTIHCRGDRREGFLARGGPSPVGFECSRHRVWSALTRRSCDRPAATGKAESGHADEQRKLVVQSRSHKATSHALRAAAIATVNTSRRVADKRSQAGKLALVLNRKVIGRVNAYSSFSVVK